MCDIILMYIMSQGGIAVSDYEKLDKPQASDRKKKRKAKKNRLIIGVILFLIVSIMFSLYMNKDNPLLYNLFSGFGFNMSNNTTVIEFDKTEDFAISEFDGNAVVARNTSVFCVDRNMNTRWTAQQNNSAPVIKTNGKYVLTYSFDVDNAMLTKDGDSMELITGFNVIGGSVNKNGYCALVTREKGYKAQVIVYSPDGEVLYKWHSADNYIIDVDVSPDNRTLAVATADFSTNTASGGLMFFNFSQEKPYAGQILENNIIMQVQFIDKDSLLVVGDIGTTVFNSLGEKETEYSYDGKKLTNYDIGTDYSLVLALNQGDSVMNDTEIKILNKDLKEKGSYIVGGSVMCIDSVRGKTLIAAERNLILLNNRGKEIKNLDINRDIKEAVLFGNGESVLVSSGSIAELLNLN